MLSVPPVPKGIFSAVGRGGLKFDVIKSGVQKGIRRNLPDLAGPLAIRGLEIGLLHKSVLSNLLNRLVVICGEDIGPACVPAVRVIDSLVSKLRVETERDRSKMESLLSTAVAYMCTQRKTRVLSFIRSYYSIALERHQDLVNEDVLNEFRNIESQDSTHLGKWELALGGPYPYIAVKYALDMLYDKTLKTKVLNMKPLTGRNTKVASAVDACWLKMYERVLDKETFKVLFQWYKNENENHIYLIYAHVLLVEPNMLSIGR